MHKISDVPVPFYIRSHPFSTMAVANIVGDFCYLGYAFAADGFVSLPKLIGALFTMIAHTLLLAYGDAQVARIAAEQGIMARAILVLREGAQYLTQSLPSRLQAKMRAKPVGISFAILTLNGCGLLTDALLHIDAGSTLHVSAMISQALMGVLIVIGTGSFAIADFVASQRRANLFLKIASMVLVCASVVNIILALLTFNFFVTVSVVAFLISNFAAFFTRINKNGLRPATL